MSMTAAQFVSNTFLEATGKLPTFVSGSTKWLKILALGNINIDDWMDEPDVDWRSLYQPDYSLGLVTNTAIYPVPTLARKISQQEGDYVRIVHSNGVGFTDYTIIDGTRQKDFAGGMRTFQDAYVTDWGTGIEFNRAFTTNDPQYGGTITIPIYTYPIHLVLDTDLVPVDIPNWLVYATAASYDATDVTRLQLVPRLEAKGNEVIKRMKFNNEAQNDRMYQPFRPNAEHIPNEAFLGY